MGQFHRSLVAWKRTHLPADHFSLKHGGLIGVFDGIWFTVNDERYTCLIVLVRPITGTIARVRGLVLVKGDESEANWEMALHQTLSTQELAHLKAITADGAHGLTALCRKYGWKYQRCHFHLLKDLEAISGKRPGSTQWLRQTALALATKILDTPSERQAHRLKMRLARLIVRSDCPKTVRKKVGGFLKHYPKFRTCYLYPKLRLPHTSNSAECVGRFVRERLGVMRGLKTVKSLTMWLDIMLRHRTTVQCLPKLPTKF